jgi:hypothetical protein
MTRFDPEIKIDFNMVDSEKIASTRVEIPLEIIL